MIDWEEIIRTESTEELKEAKLWLFQENMRLQQERTELEQAKEILSTYNQEHLIYFYDELNDEQKDMLLNQIIKINFGSTIVFIFF